MAEPAAGDATSSRVGDATTSRVGHATISRVVGVELPEQEAAALADWYADIARGVAAFPQDDLKAVEPPLRSTPGPPT